MTNSTDLWRSDDDLCCGIEGHDKLQSVYFATTFHSMQTITYIHNIYCAKHSYMFRPLQRNHLLAVHRIIKSNVFFDR